MSDLRDSFAFRNERPWPNTRLKRGVIVGHTTATAVRLWIRAAEPGDYALFLAPIAAEDKEAEKKLNAAIDTVKVSEDDLSRAAAGRLIKREFSVADFADDTTHVEDVTGLEPGRRYRYFVGRREDQRWRIVIDAIPRARARRAQKRRIGSAGLNFRTLREDGESFRFGLFSCHNPYVETKQFFEEKRLEIQGMEAWDSMGLAFERHAAGKDGDLAFVIAGGDQCYTDGRKTISIWQYLYKVMRRENGRLLPTADTMLSWFRDIYRAYWGFPQVRALYSLYPTYMIWDDHEIGDGWGSFARGEHPIYAALEKQGLTAADGDELLKRMFSAAQKAYQEYEHAHNPPTDAGKFHYHFQHRGCQFYVLDGRGRRDINREKNRILGDAQLSEFIQFTDNLDGESAPFLFVVSAVPFVHTASLVVGAAGILGPFEDDLKDAWEHELHDEERAAIMKCLWRAAARGIRIGILSGDVHASALFKIKNGGGQVIYQITSSAITYHMPRFHKWIARGIVADDGKTRDGDSFERRAFQFCPSFALVKVAPREGTAWLSMYDAAQKVTLTDDGYGQFEPQDEGMEIPITHSLGRHELRWE